MLALLAATILGALARSAHAADRAEGPAYVGGAACAGCHVEQTRLWRGSHHDLAMQAASDGTVLGDFRSGATLTYGGVTTRFYTRDGRYLVSTDGPGGLLGEHEIAFAFGVDPLQQYLVALPGGRYQALPFAWDARPKSEGGQRWFHLYPDETIGHDDPLHWTRAAQNWNAQCARCHSTNLRKGFRSADRAYATTWTDEDVSCEACHGPGSEHVTRARAADAPARVRAAVVAPLRETRSWTFDGDRPIARRTDDVRTDAELDACAPCHARRAELSDAATPGRPFLDAHLPALLTDDLYFADGQIRGEVYEYGSFVQSAMYRAGVACSDCHDPHSARLRAEGNALCGRCHLSSHFDDPKHHFHEPASTGARCVACHMPARTYMLVDERRDHGFRIPAPELAARIGAPDACTACHRDRSQAWAADVIARRRVGRDGAAVARAHFGDALNAGRKAAADAAARLLALTKDTTSPPIARATAISLLRRFRGWDASALARAGADADPLVRAAAAEAASGLGARTALEVAVPRLSDERRSVRFAAATALLGVPEGALSVEQRAARDAAIDEYRLAQLADADRPQSHVNLAAVASARWLPSEAERELRTAIGIDPDYAPAYVNLADHLRVQRRDGEAEKLLRGAILRLPRSADLRHALGLVLARQKRQEEAVTELEHAARLAPESTRYAYVLGVALHSSGRTARALDVLRDAHDRSPSDADVLVALATMLRDAGDLEAARTFAAKLVGVAPADATALRLRAELGP